MQEATGHTAALRATVLTPSLTVDDLEASIKLFEGLGMTVTDRWEEGGKLMGVMMGTGAGMIGLSQDDWAKGRGRTKGVGYRTWIETRQNVDELAARATEAGIKLDKEPHDTPWGSRAFELTTPEGFAFTISTPMKES